MTLQSHVDQTHRDVLGLVTQAQGAVVTVLKERPGRSGYRSGLPFVRFKPVLQELQIMEEILERMQKKKKELNSSSKNCQ